MVSHRQTVDICRLGLKKGDCFRGKLEIRDKNITFNCFDYLYEPILTVVQDGGSS